MTKKMLIDATHAEETRVVVMDGNRLEDYDVEASTKRYLKGNIYLAKVIRVEPSLQAAFVEFGGGRHGFLAFGEIHPDYYQIPVADRQRLLEMQEAEAREEEDEDDDAPPGEDDASFGAPAERPAPVRDAQPAASEQADQDAAPPPAGPAEEDSLTLAGLETPSVKAIVEPAESADTDPLAAPVDPAVEATVQAAYAHQAELASDPDLPQPDPGQVSQSAATAVGLRITPDVARAEFPAEDEGAEPASGPAEDRTGVGAGAAAPGSDLGADLAPERADSMPAPAAPDEEDRAGTGQAEASPAEAFGTGTAEGALSPLDGDDASGIPITSSPSVLDDAPAARDDGRASPVEDAPVEEAPPPEAVGGVDQPADEVRRRPPPRFLRHYSIQEVIRRRQILLVQATKEERGTKGAALTTYISLAGRYSVLMPNSPRGGGVSRKITQASDRRRLKEVMAELDLPRGMGMIIRTAGANRPKAEIVRDCENLLTLWDDIRERTMRSVAPALIHEEASLIKRTIRDLYSREIEEVVVDGEQGWRAARDYMRTLMPAHARKVQLWRDPQPLFAKQNVELQLDAIMQPQVQLRSGGYLVINQAEALVAIDVNSGRSTRERGIEETALRTNLEAADEVARQLRLRDLAGLIVIDFIDMESRRANEKVERRLKDALRYDRARIQVGQISHFGLLEMSRQRLRPSLAETSTVPCPHCGGTGHVRSTESAALHVLRAIEEEGAKRRTAEIVVHVAGSVALYVLNHKRARLAEVESRYGLRATFAADDTLVPPQMRVERLRSWQPGEAPPITYAPAALLEEPDDVADTADVEPMDADADADRDAAPARQPRAAADGESEEGRRRKRRRRRGRGDRREEGDTGAGTMDAETDADAESEVEPSLADAVASDEAVRETLGDTLGDGTGDGPDASGQDVAAPDEAVEPVMDAAPPAGDAEAAPEGDDDRPRRRGRRGGRRRRRGEPGPESEEGAPQPSLESEGNEAPAERAERTDRRPSPPRVPAYTGPTPADPFAQSGYDIFEALEQAEEQRITRTAQPAAVGHLQAPGEVAEERVHYDPTIAGPAAAPDGTPTEQPDPPLNPDDVFRAPDQPPTQAAERAFAEASTATEATTAEVVTPQPTAEPAAPEHPVPDSPKPTSQTAEPLTPPKPETGPAVVPIVIGSEGGPTERKRGWWRR